MLFFRQSLLLALPLLGIAACEETPTSPKKQPKKDIRLLYSSPNEAFQELLNALPEESLHAALHSLARFREGIFESDRRGVAYVHEENPPLATKLIVEAVKDLKKRQSPPSNSTAAPSSSADSKSTSNNAASSSEAPAKSSAVLVPVVVTTTDNQGRTSVASNEVLSQPTASVNVAVTRTDSEGRTTTATETRPAVVQSTTNSSGNAIVTTKPVEFAPTVSQVITSTNDRGETFLTTYTPAGGRASSVVLVTSTGADGKPTVHTSFAYVEPAKATNTAAPSPSDNRGKPGLQEAGAERFGRVSAAVVGGFVGGVALLML